VSASPRIDVRQNEAQHRFEIDLGGGELAIAEYRLVNDRIVFTHTLVPPAHEGRGYGTALIEAGLAYAREQGLKVVPRCRFFAAYIAGHPEQQDLLHADSLTAD
jgi:uncharacterized protein